MPLYEHVFLARQDLSAQAAEELAAQYKGVIEQNGGEVVGAAEYWGIKTLNYRIRKTRKAHFSMLRLNAPPAAVEEMERQQRINEDVIRFLTVRVDAHEEGPSAMMRKADRDRDRDERRGERRRDRESRGPREGAEEAETVQE
jgi:small subunit ribosomal protein S6